MYYIMYRPTYVEYISNNKIPNQSLINQFAYENEDF